MHFSEKLSLKYPENVPDGYDVSQMQYTYDFINLVLNHDASIDGAIKGVANEYDLSETFLRQYLIEDKYILKKISRKEISNQIKSYNTKSLKKILKKHGIKTSGKRERIEERIIENDLFESPYSLSSKSKIFYKNKKRRFRIYEKYLYEFYYFDEFNEYYMDNFRKKEEKIPIEFVNHHISNAIENENHRSYAINNQILVEIYQDRKNYKNMLRHVLKNLCINLNPVWKLDDLKNHWGIPYDTYENLIFLKNEMGKDRIISTYFVVWDSFNFEKEIISKYTGYRCLKDLLNYKDFQKINKNLVTDFYSNDDLVIKKITQKTLFDF